MNTFPSKCLSASVHNIHTYVLLTSYPVTQRCHSGMRYQHACLFNLCAVILYRYRKRKVSAPTLSMYVCTTDRIIFRMLNVNVDSVSMNYKYFIRPFSGSETRSMLIRAYCMFSLLTELR